MKKTNLNRNTKNVQTVHKVKQNTENVTNLNKRKTEGEISLQMKLKHTDSFYWVLVLQ